MDPRIPKAMRSARRRVVFPMHWFFEYTKETTACQTQVLARILIEPRMYLSCWTDLILKINLKTCQRTNHAWQRIYYC